MSYPQQPGQPGPEEPNPYGQQPPPPPPPQYGGGQPQYGAPAPAPQQGDPGTLDLPWYGIGFADAVKRAFQKFARFDGRASRGELWWFVLAVVLVEFVLYVPFIVGTSTENQVLAGLFGLVLGVFLLAIIVPYIALGVRRLHDAGFSGWLMLLAIVPCVSIVLIVLWILPSKPEGMKYDRASGPAPGGYGQPGAYGG